MLERVAPALVIKDMRAIIIPLLSPPPVPHATLITLLRKTSKRRFREKSGEGKG